MGETINSEYMMDENKNREDERREEWNCEKRESTQEKRGNNEKRKK